MMMIYSIKVNKVLFKIIIPIIIKTEGWLIPQKKDRNMMIVQEMENLKV